MNTLEHAKIELKLAGYNIDREIPETFDSDNDYTDAIAKNVLDMLKVFSEAGHSGFSASCTLQLFNKLANQKNLTPLTNNPDEWVKHEDGTYQSKRDYECFSKDGLKTYYKLSDGQVEVEEGCVTQDKTKYIYYPLTPTK